MYVEVGNNVCIDGWTAYNYLDDPLSGYHHYSHIHGDGDFGIGVQSKSHIEAIWAQIKSKIKENYHINSPKNLFFLLEKLSLK